MFTVNFSIQGLYKFKNNAIYKIENKSIRKGYEINLQDIKLNQLISAKRSTVSGLK